MSKQSCITKFVVCSSAPTVLVATVILKIIKRTGAGTRKVTRQPGGEKMKGGRERKKKPVL